jgi:hypothetical protein
MPPRKSRRTKNKSGDDSINPKDVKQLRFSQQVVYEDGSLGVLKTFDLKSIKAHLKEQQSEVEIQRDLIDITALQEQRDAADRRYKDSLASEKRAGKAPGRSAASREYKASLDCLNARLRNANRRGKDHKNKEARSGVRDRWAEAQWHLEDFLYYQETIRRWKRWGVMDPNERAAYEARRPLSKILYKLAADGDGYYQDWLHELLNYFDERGIGDQRYMQGLYDPLGNANRDTSQTERTLGIGWQDLHLWTPRRRRWHSGLPRRINVDENGVGRIVDGEEQFEYDESQEEGGIMSPLK